MPFIPSLAPNGGLGGDHFYVWARGRPLGRVPKKRGSRGGALWGAQGRFGGLQRDFEIVEKPYVFPAF